jgi:hypothetical protein
MRGKMDFYASHDFEDIITVMDGRSEIIEEIKQVDTALKNFLLKQFLEFYNKRDFHDALPGHFNVYAGLGEQRLTIFIEKLTDILE